MWQKVCTVVEKSEAKGMYSCGKKCGERYVQLWKKVERYVQKVWRKVCTVVEKSEAKGMYSLVERYVQLWKKVKKVCTVVEKSEAKGMYSCGKK